MAGGLRTAFEFDRRGTIQATKAVADERIPLLLDGQGLAMPVSRCWNALTATVARVRPDTPIAPARSYAAPGGLTDRQTVQ